MPKARTPARAPARRPSPLAVSAPVAPPAIVQSGNDDDAPTAADAVSSLLAQFGEEAAGYKVRIDRKDGRGERDYLGSLPLSADLLDDVKSKYGGGKYRGRISTASGAYVQSIHFGIAGTPRDPETVELRERAAAPSSDLVRIEGILAGVVETVRELSSSLRAPVQQPKAASSLEEFTAIAKVIRDMTPPPAPPAAPVSFTDVFTMMDKYQEMRDRITDDAEPRDSLAGVVDRGLTAITPLLKQKLDMEEKILTGRRAKRTAAPAAPALQLAPSDPIAALAAKIPGSARNYLANLARADKNPDLYAEVVLDALGDKLFAQLPDMLGRDDFATVLCNAVPQFAPYPAWFGKLADSLRASLLEDADESDAPPEKEAATA